MTPTLAWRRLHYAYTSQLTTRIRKTILQLVAETGQIGLRLSYYILNVLILKVLALFPAYLLHLCDGMNSGYPAILTPQLREDCSEFRITTDDESWIGIAFFNPFPFF